MKCHLKCQPCVPSLRSLGLTSNHTSAESLGITEMILNDYLNMVYINNQSHRQICAALKRSMQHYSDHSQINHYKIITRAGT